MYLELFEKVVDYSLSVSFDVLFPGKFSGFERFTRSRNYLVNSSGIFGVVETDDTLANTQLFAMSMIAETGLQISPKRAPLSEHARAVALALAELVRLRRRGERGSVRLGFFREVRRGF